MPKWKIVSESIPVIQPSQRATAQLLCATHIKSVAGITWLDIPIATAAVQPGKPRQLGLGRLVLHDAVGENRIRIRGNVTIDDFEWEQG